jgi:hypothetical protein
MTKPGEPPGRYFAAPEPPTASEREGMKWGQELARRYLPEGVRLAAAIAFGDSNATTWTRLQSARLIAQIAGAIPETIPEASQPGADGGAHA